MFQVYSKKENCYGCTACENLCPCDAITMQPDEQGFLYPIINNDKCIDCKKCEKNCMFNNVVKKEEEQVGYAARRTDLKKRMESRSGGVFAAVSEKLLKRNYSIYGAAFADVTDVRHIRIESEDELVRLKGSKYTQSNLNSTFCMVKDDLLGQKPVLFSGTPCQVAGLLTFLNVSKVDTSLLITVDVVCHGVPSPLLYKDLIKLYEKIERKKIVKFDFRPKNKDCSWMSHLQAYYLEDNPSKPHYTNVFTRIFYDHYCLRPSCFNCQYSSIDRVGDFTIADFWGIEAVFSDMNDATGTSGVVVNSVVGMNALDELENLDKRECDVLQIAKHQPNMKKCSDKPHGYDEFWESYLNKGSGKTIRKYGGYTLTNRIKGKIKYIMEKFT